MFKILMLLFYYSLLMAFSWGDSLSGSLAWFSGHFTGFYGTVGTFANAIDASRSLSFHLRTLVASSGELLIAAMLLAALLMALLMALSTALSQVSLTGSSNG